MTSGLAVIVAFIGARLAEDKKRAEGLLFACRIPEKTPDFFACGGPAAEAYWEHFGPARMLRDVEADAKLLRELRSAEGNTGGDWGEGEAGYAAGLEAGLVLAVKVRAERWSDHPDYQEGWKP